MLRSTQYEIDWDGIDEVIDFGYGLFEAYDEDTNPDALTVDEQLSLVIIRDQQHPLRCPTDKALCRINHDLTKQQPQVPASWMRAMKFMARH